MSTANGAPVLRHATDPRKHRGEDYPAAGDGLDAVMKGFRAIIDSGLIVLPPETVAWVERCEAVKARFPKPAAALDPEAPASA